MTLSRDYFDWQSKQTFDPERDGYSGQINNRANAASALSADLFNSSIYVFSWFGVSGNTATFTANSSWQPITGPGAADLVNTFYPYSWRDKVRQLNGGILTNSNFGLYAPFTGWYKAIFNVSINTTPASGGAITFFSPGIFIGGVPVGMGRIYGDNLGSGAHNGLHFMNANTLVRPAMFCSSVGNNGVFRVTDLYFDLTLLSFD